MTYDDVLAESSGTGVSRRTSPRGGKSMASVSTKVWTAKGPTGRRVKHVSWGYSLMVDGQREKRFSREWQTEAQAWDALAQRQKEIAAGQVSTAAGRPARSAELVEEYSGYKANKRKRSLKEDTRILTTRILPAFGGRMPVKRSRPR